MCTWSSINLSINWQSPATFKQLFTDFKHLGGPHNPLLNLLHNLKTHIQHATSLPEQSDIVCAVAAYPKFETKLVQMMATKTNTQLTGGAAMGEMIVLTHSFPILGSRNTNRNLPGFMTTVPELYCGDNFQIKYGPFILYWNFDLKLELFNLNLVFQGIMLGKFISFGSKHTEHFWPQLSNLPIRNVTHQ
jgi:hypothetical protein